MWHSERLVVQRLRDESNKSNRDVRARVRQGALDLSGMPAAGTGRHTSGIQSVILTSLIPLSSLESACHPCMHRAVVTVEDWCQQLGSDLCKLVCLPSFCVNAVQTLRQWKVHSRPLAVCYLRQLWWYWKWAQSRCFCNIEVIYGAGHLDSSVQFCWNDPSISRSSTVLITARFPAVFCSEGATSP